MKKLITLLGFVTYIFSANAALAFTVGVVASNADVNAYPDGVYLDGVVDYSQTAEAADTTADDVWLPDNSMSTEILYIGSNTVFDTIDFDVTTAGNSSKFCFTTPCHHYTLEYYDGLTSDWESLTYTDNTNNFETAAEGTWEFEVPEAWDSDGTKTTVNSQTLFWVRITPASGTTINSPASAGEVALRAYNVEITLENDIAALEGLVSEDFVVSGGSSNDVAGFRDMEGGVYQLALDAGLTDSNYRIGVGETGYVSESINTGVLSTIMKSLAGELPYSHVVTTIDNSTGAVITPDTVTVGSVSCTISGSTAYCPLSLSEDGTSTTIAEVTVTKSGYDSATDTLNAERDATNDAQVSTLVPLTETAVVAGPTGYFTFRVEETDGTDLTTLAQTNFTVSGGTDNTVYAFTNNGDGTYTYELATENADNTYSISATVTGYVTESISTGAMTTGVTNTGTLELDASGPATEANLTINVTDEDGDAITSLSEADFDVSGGTSNAIHAFTNAGSGNYVLSLSIDNSDNNYTIEVSEDGYVAEDITTGEMTGDLSKSVSLDFAYKLTVFDEEGDTISSASVKAGDDYGTSCSYLGAGVYGCDVPVADTDLDYKVTLSGYETEYGEFNSDRTDHTDAQVSESVSLTVGESDCEADFDDIFGHWAEDYISELYCRGVVNGLDEDTFGPSNNATRAEFLKMALLNAGYDVDGAFGETFSDVSSGDWFYEYVSFGVEEDFIEGYSDGTFQPNDPINRAEALVITMRIAGVDEYDVDSDWDEFDDVDSDDWYAYAVETAADKGIVEGYDDGDFKPGNSITRAEVAAISVRTYDEYYAD